MRGVLFTTPVPIIPRKKRREPLRIRLACSDGHGEVCFLCPPLCDIGPAIRSVPSGPPKRIQDEKLPPGSRPPESEEGGGGGTSRKRSGDPFVWRPWPFSGLQGPQEKGETTEEDDGGRGGGGGAGRPFPPLRDTRGALRPHEGQEKLKAPGVKSSPREGVQPGGIETGGGGKGVVGGVKRGRMIQKQEGEEDEGDEKMEED